MNPAALRGPFFSDPALRQVHSDQLLQRDSLLPGCRPKCRAGRAIEPDQERDPLAVPAHRPGESVSARAVTMVGAALSAALLGSRTRGTNHPQAYLRLGVEGGRGAGVPYWRVVGQQKADNPDVQDRCSRHGSFQVLRRCRLTPSSRPPPPTGAPRSSGECGRSSSAHLEAVGVSPTIIKRASRGQDRRASSCLVRFIPLRVTRRAGFRRSANGQETAGGQGFEPRRRPCCRMVLAVPHPAPDSSAWREASSRWRHGRSIAVKSQQVESLCTAPTAASKHGAGDFDRTAADRASARAWPWPCFLGATYLATLREDRVAAGTCAQWYEEAHELRIAGEPSDHQRNNVAKSRWTIWPRYGLASTLKRILCQNSRRVTRFAMKRTRAATSAAVIVS